MDVKDMHGCGEDVAAYALGALPAEDADRFRTHLQSCDLCRADLAALQPVVEALPDTVDPVDPPPEVRKRVMAVVEREVAEAQAAVHRPARELSWSWLMPRAALAAACVMLLAGLGVGLALRVEQTRVVTGPVALGGAQAELRLEGDRGTLVVDGLPNPPRDRVWQVWLVRGEKGKPQPTDALFTTNRRGMATVTVPGDMSGVSKVLVSEEPVGGSPTPTTVPTITIEA